MNNDEHKDCPNCGEEASRDSAHIGVGVIYGPWGCACGWSDDPDYNQLDPENTKPNKRGGYKDQWGNLHPKGSPGAIRRERAGA